MPKVTIDGNAFDFSPGETVIQVADRNKVEIPRFCYHPSLSVVAQCRMCAVEVEKMPKLQTACSLPATDGMVVQTKTEKVKSMQASVMEFLLANHPLDCPICDEAGECQLQDYTFAYARQDTTYDETRRTYIDLDMGPVIKKNMNRCIHCTRCIRFCDEIGGYREMVALKRGNSTEITTVDGRPLQTEYAGNLADICPTGSLTLVDFRFEKRAWYLKKTPSVCEGCSQGCNTEVHQENNAIFRHIPRENMAINKWWLCDEGRFSFKYVNSESRLSVPVVRRTQDDYDQVDWAAGVQSARAKLNGKIVVLVGSDLTNEELQLIKLFAQNKLKNAEVCHFGTPGVQTVAQDKPIDKLLRRASKTANLNGVEKMGIKAYDGSSFDSAVVFRGGRAVLVENLKANVRGAIVGVGVFMQEDASLFDVVLPGLSYAEKTGTIVNWQGTEQRFEQAIDPIGQSKSINEVFAMWS